MFGNKKDSKEIIAEEVLVAETKTREMITQQNQSYAAIVKRQFKKNRPAVWAMRLLAVFAFIAIIADFIANEKPLYAKIEGQTYFPVLKSYAVGLGLSKWPADLAQAEWKDLKYDKVMWPLIPYSSGTLDLFNAQFKSPTDEQENLPSKHFHHRLGTDDLGRDVLAGMIHGTRIAMLVGILSMTIATILGLFFGSLAGYFGDNGIKMPRANLIMSLFGLIVGIFYAFIAVQVNVLLGIGIVIAIILLFNLIAIPLKKLKWFNKPMSVPMDILVMRLIEIMRSIPTLILILSIVAILTPSIWLVMIVLGLVGWTGIARFVRGELLRVRNLEYIEAANSLGFSRARIILKHALPNSLTPVLIVIAFGIAGAILTESTLSFLGIGVPSDTITWGKLLSLGRQDISAWWLVLFPGFAIFITVTIFNLLGDGLADAIDPRLKQ